MVLNEGDSIIIPKTMDVVHITGELMNLQGNSISAPYFNSKRANYYVKNFAGGFSKLNDRSNTVVVYPNGIAKKSKNLRVGFIIAQTEELLLFLKMELNYTYQCYLLSTDYSYN